MRNSSNFYIANNNFFTNYFGVLSVKSSSAGGLIIFENDGSGNQTGNFFERSYRSIWATGNNSNLKIRCNTTDNPGLSLYGRNWYNVGSLAQQGNFSTTNYRKPAGNQFNYLSATNIRREIKTFQPFWYYSHSAPAQYIPTADGLVYINSSSKNCPSFLQCCTDPCSGSPCNPCCRTAQISMLEEQIVLLKQEYDSTVTVLDKGQTGQLITAINHNNPTPPGQLKNMLLAATPLSDTVLFALINRAAPTPPGIFKDIMVPNSPVSEEILPSLLSKLATLPPGIAQQIYAAQASVAYRTLTLINNEIRSAKEARQNELNQVLSYYIQNDSLQKAITLLEQEDAVWADQILLATYIADSNLVAAQTKLSEMSANNAEEQAYLDIQGLLIALALQGKTIFDMDSAQEHTVREIANMAEPNLAMSNAQTILRLVYNEEFSTAIDTLLPSAKTNPYLYYGNNTLANDYLLIEDSAGATFIPLRSFSCGMCIIHLFDITGKRVGRYEIKDDLSPLTISGNNFENGIYILQVEADGIIRETMKIVFIK